MKIWLANKLQKLVLFLHPVSRRNKQELIQLAIDMAAYGTAIHRVDPTGVTLIKMGDFYCAYPKNNDIKLDPRDLGKL